LSSATDAVADDRSLSGYLLDTDVISMLSPSRSGPSPAFLGWLERMDADGRLFLSVVTIHEIERASRCRSTRARRPKQ
jgi:predicted nucleic acid-binding protein